MDFARRTPGLLQGKFVFRKLPNGNLDKSKVICTLCSAEFVYCGSSSSLKYHLNARHPYANGPGADGAQGRSVARQTTAMFESSQVKPTPGPLQPVSSAPAPAVSPVSPALSARLTDLLAQWISSNCRPISLVEDDGLERLLQAATGDPSYKLPARRAIMRRMLEQHAAEKLAEATSVALTGDCWTSADSENYLCVTAHLIDASWKRHSFDLGVMKTAERHFGEACARQFLYLANQWGMVDKISTIGTDSGPYSAAAGTILPFEHLPCVGHVVQRAIVKALQESGFDDVLAKCREVVGYFQHSPADSDELHAQQAFRGQDVEPLVEDVPTRWKSTLEMIKRMRRNRDALHATLSQQKHNLALLTNADDEMLAKLEKLLEPCRYITELLGGDKYAPCSVVLPALCHLQRAMNISDDDPAYSVQFKTAFTKDLQERREKINLEWLKVASALDPRFKDLKCLPRAEREPVWGKLSELVKGKEPAVKEGNPEPPKKKPALLLMGSDSESDEETPVDNTVERYMVEPSVSLDQCPLKWWSERTAVYGKMAPIARKYLGTPATTVPCERLFFYSRPYCMELVL